MDGRELALYDIVNASVANISAMLAYLRRNVVKDDPMDMDAYEDWIKEMYDNWPMPGETLSNGRVKKKNAGEISLTILAEIFSWHYPESKTLTIVHSAEDDWHYVLSRLEQGKISPSKLISHRFSLEKIDQGFRIMRDKSEDYIKIMAEFTGN